MIFAVVTFWLALVGLIGLFWLKSWELKHSRVLCQERRARLDASAHHAVKLTREHMLALPSYRSFAAVLQTIARELIILFARIAHFIERRAHMLAMRISHSAHESECATPRVASDFLREVSNHKRGLDTEAVKRETTL